MATKEGGGGWIAYLFGCKSEVEVAAQQDPLDIPNLLLLSVIIPLKRWKKFSVSL